VLDRRAGCAWERQKRDGPACSEMGLDAVVASEYGLGPVREDRPSTSSDAPIHKSRARSPKRPGATCPRQPAFAARWEALWPVSNRTPMFSSCSTFAAKFVWSTKRDRPPSTPSESPTLTWRPANELRADLEMRSPSDDLARIRPNPEGDINHRVPRSDDATK